MSVPSSASLFLRQKWLIHTGGIPRPAVKNNEWLHLLQQETRNTLEIEGEFTTPEELESALDKNPKRQGKIAKILGVYEAATQMYELALSQFEENVFEFRPFFVRAGHGMLTRSDDDFLQKGWKPGNWRKTNVIIDGANFQPPDFSQLPQIMEKICWISEKHKTWSPWRRAAVFHAFFEHTHPFPDGNGRIGRILANFVLLAHGFPNVAIKFKQVDEYLKALEQADPIIDKILHGKVAWTKFPPSAVSNLENIFAVRLTKTMDRLICNRWEAAGNELLPISEVAKKTSRTAGGISVMASNKQIIAVQNNGRWMSHPALLQPPKK
jgi:Fic family protein